MGEKSNGYRYTVSYKGTSLISVVLRPECCRGLPKCPIKRDVLPLTPCREYLRARAIELAHEEWVKFLRSFI